MVNVLMQKLQCGGLIGGGLGNGNYCTFPKRSPYYLFFLEISFTRFRLDEVFAYVSLGTTHD